MPGQKSNQPKRVSANRQVNKPYKRLVKSKEREHIEQNLASGSNDNPALKQASPKKKRVSFATETNLTTPQFGKEKEPPKTICRPSPTPIQKAGVQPPNVLVGVPQKQAGGKTTMSARRFSNVSRQNNSSGKGGSKGGGRKKIALGRSNPREKLNANNINHQPKAQPKPKAIPRISIASSAASRASVDSNPSNTNYPNGNINNQMTSTEINKSVSFASVLQNSQRTQSMPAIPSDKSNHNIIASTKTDSQQSMSQPTRPTFLAPVAAPKKGTMVVSAKRFSGPSGRSSVGGKAKAKSKSRSRPRSLSVSSRKEDSQEMPAIKKLAVSSDQNSNLPVAKAAPKGRVQNRAKMLMKAMTKRKETAPALQADGPGVSGTGVDIGSVFGTGSRRSTGKGNKYQKLISDAVEKFHMRIQKNQGQNIPVCLEQVCSLFANEQMTKSGAGGLILSVRCLNNVRARVLLPYWHTAAQTVELELGHWYTLRCANFNALTAANVVIGCQGPHRIAWQRPKLVIAWDFTKTEPPATETNPP